MKNKMCNVNPHSFMQIKNIRKEIYERYHYPGFLINIKSESV